MGNMFLKKIDELCSNMPNLFDTADYILIGGLVEHNRDHDEILEKVLWICRQSVLKWKKDKCLFRSMGIPLLQ